MKHSKFVLLLLLIFGGLYVLAQDVNPPQTGGGTSEGSTTSGKQKMDNIINGTTPVVEKPAGDGSSASVQQGGNSETAPATTTRKVQRTQVVPINQLPSFANRPLNNFDFRQGTRKRMRGFRIQMYWGNSLRTDYLKAKRMGDKINGAFPELVSYVSFDQPHWRCRIGDFKTRAGAARYLDRMRKIAPEAMIVRSEIYIYQ